MLKDLLFNEDSVLVRILTLIANIMFLNLLFILCCLPIVTIGASVTALYSITLKMVTNRDKYIVRGFLQAFKNNFKQSTVIWLIMLFAGVLLIGDWYLANNMKLSIMETLNYVFAFLGFVYLMILSYVFPIQSKFENKISSTIINAAIIGIAHFLPYTLLIMIINAIPIAFLWLNADALLYLVIPFMLLAGFSSIAYANSWIFKRIFAKHLPKEDELAKEDEP